MAKGPRGPQGAQGAQGRRGPQGSRGPQGASGAQGRKGSDGSRGAQGASGAQGAKGSQGAQGSQGAAGSQGLSGGKGISGSQGAGGAQGAQGAQGKTGPQGAQGSQGSSGSAGFLSRTTITATTSSLSADSSALITFPGFKSYLLLKVGTSHAAWITLYGSNSARAADFGRSEQIDPLPGSGVIAEIITTAAGTVLLTPATIGWNNEVPPNTNIYAKVVNRSGFTAVITVTLTAVQLES